MKVDLFFDILSSREGIDHLDENLTPAVSQKTLICRHGEPIDKEPVEIFGLRRCERGVLCMTVRSRHFCLVAEIWRGRRLKVTHSAEVKGLIVVFPLFRSAADKVTASAFDSPQVGALAQWRFWSTSTTWRRRRRRRSR